MITRRRGGATLYTYSSPESEPTAIPAKTINGYLIDGPQIFVGSRGKPLSLAVPEVSYGSKPADGKNLSITLGDHAKFMADPVTSKYLRSFVGARELIHAEQRWCLWMADADFDPQDLRRSDLLRERVEACRDWRSQQTPTGDAYKLRNTPHLFRPNRSRPQGAYLCIPSHFSEERRFATVARLEATVIASNAVFIAPDEDGFLFALISSSMYLTWQRVIGGRLESRLRFSNTVVWNNFPLPSVSEKLKQQIIDAGQGVLEARALHPERSLADHYNPLAMDPELLKAHAALDRVVDKAFGAKRALSTDEQRLELLFKRYVELTEGAGDGA